MPTLIPVMSDLRRRKVGDPAIAHACRREVIHIGAAKAGIGLTRESPSETPSSIPMKKAIGRGRLPAESPFVCAPAA